MPTRTPDKILLLGDTHGDLGWIQVAARVAAEEGCDGIVQLGDFGFWPNEDGTLNRHWLEAVDRAVTDAGVWMRVVDGNHDAHGLAREAFEADEQGVRRWGESCDWADRGSTWSWSGRSFAALGGAQSLDAHLRTAGVDWWDTERITGEEIERLLGSVEGTDLDVLFTHDSPWAELVTGFYADHRNKPHLWVLADEHQDMLAEVVKKIRPSLLIHGHFHVRYSADRRISEDRFVRLEGLASNIEQYGSMAILDVGTLAVLDPFAPRAEPSGSWPEGPDNRPRFTRGRR